MKTKQFPMATFATDDLDYNGHSLEDFLNPDLDLSVEGPDSGLDALYFTVPGQVAAPGETDLLNMNGVVLKNESYETFKEWAEHPFTHTRVMTGTVDENGIEQWYPVSIAPFDVRGKFEFIRCHIISWEDMSKIKDALRYFYFDKFNFVNLNHISFDLHPQPGGLWGTKGIKHEDLQKFIPRALPDWNDTPDHDEYFFELYTSSGTRGIRPYDLHEYVKNLELLETKYLAFSVFQLGTEKRFREKMKEVKEILENLDLVTVIIPYKGNEIYGDNADTIGIF